MQPARRVHDDNVEAKIARFAERAFRALDGIQLRRRIEHAQRGLLANDVQLLNCGWTFHVGRDEERMPALLGEPLAQLSCRGRLSRTLQPEQQYDARPFARRPQASLGVAEERDHLVANDLDDLLRRRETA